MDDWKTPLVLGLACFVLLPGTLFSLGKPRQKQTAAIHAVLFGLLASLLQPLLGLKKEGFGQRETCSSAVIPWDLFKFCRDDAGKDICKVWSVNIDTDNNNKYDALVFSADPGKGIIVVSSNCTTATYFDAAGTIIGILSWIKNPAVFIPFTHQGPGKEYSWKLSDEVRRVKLIPELSTKVGTSLPDPLSDGGLTMYLPWLPKPDPKYVPAEKIGDPLGKLGKNSEGLSTGAIVGISIGSAVVLILILWLAFGRSSDSE